MRLSCIVSANGRNVGNIFIFSDLFEKHCQDWGVRDIVSSDLNGPDFHRSLVSSDRELTTDTTFRSAMLARMPFAFYFDLDPSTVDQEMERPIRTPLRDVDRQGFLPMAEHAEIRDRPVQADQMEQTFNKAGRLPLRHAEENFQRQTGLDRGIAMTLPPSSSPGQKPPSIHHKIEAYRQ